MASNDILMKVGVDVGQAINQLNRVSRAAQKMGDSGGKSSKQFTGKLNALSDGLRRTSLRMTPLSALAGGIFVKAIKSSAEFSQQMAIVGAIAGANKKQMGQLEDAAMDWGSSSIYSINEVADGMKGLAEQGYSTAEIIKTMPSALNLAQGSAAKLADSTMLLAVATNVYGKGTYSAAHLSDVFTKSANTSAASVEYLQTAFQYSAQPAKTLGVGIEDLTAVTGILANKGQRASRSGTMMGQVFSHLSKPTSAGQQALDKLGISAFDSQGNFIGLSKFVGEYAEATKGMTQEQKLATAKTIFGQRAMTAWQDLVDAGAGKIDKYSGSLKKSSGYAQKAADKANNNLGAALDNLQDSFKVLDHALMKSVDGPLRKFIKWLDDMVDKMSKMDSKKLQAIVLALVGIAALAPLLGILAIIVDGLAAIGTIAGVVAPVITALWFAITSPIGLVVGAIAAIVAALTYFFTKTKKGKKIWEKFSKALGGSINAIGLVGAVVALLGSGLLKLASSFKKPLKTVKKFTKATKTVGPLAGKTGGKLAGMGAKAAGIGVGIGVAAAGIGVLVFAIAKLAKTGTKGLVALGAMTGAIVILAATFAMLKTPLTAAIPAMLALSAAMLSAGASALMIGTAISLAGAGIKLASEAIMILVQALILLGNNINVVIALSTALGTALAALVVTFLAKVIAAVPQIAEQFLQMFTSLLEMVAEYVPTIVGGLANILLGFLSSLITYVPQIVAKFVELLVAIMNAVADNAPTLIAVFTNMVVSIINALTDSLPQFITAGTNFIVSLLKGVSDNLGRVISAAVDVVVKFINGIGDNLGRIINAGVDLLGKFIMGIIDAIPRLTSIAVQAVEKFVYGVGNALGQILGSGHKLLKMFIQGIKDGYGKARQSGKGAGDSVKDGTSGISLHGAGSSIMGSFLGGLRAKWGAVKNFVGGIAGWIKKHKGPISYDRRLLIPAGKSIMSGLNEGLNNQYKSVMRTVSGVAANIEDAMSLSPTVDLGTGVSDVKSQLGVDVSNEVAVQPANIKLNLGSTSYEAFVNDISQQQGRSARLKKSNTVR